MAFTKLGKCTTCARSAVAGRNCEIVNSKLFLEKLQCVCEETGALEALCEEFELFILYYIILYYII